ncbi:AAA family ATPase [Qipengyuania sp.]|uniref:AAA family ATPase n=1 Tax=Qipengyuania sp. TaxID=2004515 RepID=UPI0035110629
MSAHRRAAITGAPGAGKSTLLDELARRGHAIAPEVARPILKRPGGMALREADPLGFAEAMLEAQMRAWETPVRASRVIYDRGFADIAGFLRAEGLAVPAPIDRACRECRFDGPIFRAPAWRAIYRSDAERIQDWQQALASDEAVTGAWRDYGYQLIDLPLLTPARRADFVSARL